MSDIFPGWLGRVPKTGIKDRLQQERLFSHELNSFDSKFVVYFRRRRHEPQLTIHNENNVLTFERCNVYVHRRFYALSRGCRKYQYCLWNS